MKTLRSRILFAALAAALLAAGTVAPTVAVAYPGAIVSD